jgi:hypothetical protein
MLLAMPRLVSRSVDSGHEEILIYRSLDRSAIVAVSPSGRETAGVENLYRFAYWV